MWGSAETSALFADRDRGTFGVSRRWASVDTGEGSAAGEGDALAKALDPFSMRLRDADDRMAFGGVATFPEGKRRPRDGGSQKIMGATLEMIAAQNRQTAVQRVGESWGRSREGVVQNI